MHSEDTPEASMAQRMDIWWSSSLVNNREAFEIPIGLIFFDQRSAIPWSKVRGASIPELYYTIL